MTAAPARSRREEILAAAAREFSAGGYAGARMDRIAAAARVNKQLLFHYFDSKDGLFEAVLSGLLERLEPPAVGTDEPMGAISRMTAGLAAAAGASPGIVAIMAGANADPDLPGGAVALVRAWRQRILGRLRSAIEDGQRRGYFRDDIDPEEVAALALAAGVGTAVLTEAPGPATLASMLKDYCAWR